MLNHWLITSIGSLNYLYVVALCSGETFYVKVYFMLAFKKMKIASLICDWNDMSEGCRCYIDLYYKLCKLVFHLGTILIMTGLHNGAAGTCKGFYVVCDIIIYNSNSLKNYYSNHVP